MKSYENPMGLWQCLWQSSAFFPYEMAILGDQKPLWKPGR